MLLRRSFVVFLIFIAAVQLCAGDDERRDDEDNRGRRRRGDERRGGRGQRRIAGERRQRGPHGQQEGVPRGERRRIGGRRRASLTPVRVSPAYTAPENIIKNENGNGKGRYNDNGNRRVNGHVKGHLNGNGHVNGNGYVNGNGHLNGNGHVNGNGHANGNGYANGRPSYLCPAGFVRLGNACYLLSQHITTWQEAHFACRDLGSQLAGLETAWEDETMRKYLNKNELARLERWIGGIFNWEQKRWIWGSSGKRMSYQGFSRRSPHEDRQWHCVMMDPTRLYRWTHRSCIEQRHFICEAPLQKELPAKDKNEI